MENDAPQRIRLLEQDMAIHDHRLSELEKAQLPSRMQAVEQSVGEIRGDVSEIRKTTEHLASTLGVQHADITTRLDRIYTFGRTIVWMSGVVYAGLQMIPYITSGIELIAMRAGG